MINLRRVIKSRAFSQVVTFERTHSDFVDGIAIETTETFTARAIVRPAGKDDLELLEEGQRFFPTMLIHTIEPISIGDYMHYHGERWRVVNAQDWKDYGFYKCIAIRLSGTEESNSNGFVVT